MRNRQFHCSLISCSLLFRVSLGPRAQCLGPAGDNIRHLGQTQDLILHSSRQISAAFKSLSSPPKNNNKNNKTTPCYVVAILNSSRHGQCSSPHFKPQNTPPCFSPADLCRSRFHARVSQGPSGPSVLGTMWSRSASEKPHHRSTLLLRPHAPPPLPACMAWRRAGQGSSSSLDCQGQGEVLSVLSPF